MFSDDTKYLVENLIRNLQASLSYANVSRVDVENSLGMAVELLGKMGESALDIQQAPEATNKPYSYADHEFAISPDELSLPEHDDGA